MCKILLVDDYRDLLETTTLLFEALGHEIRAVDNGAAAVLEADSFDPDIVFLDLAMPHMDGFTAARLIRLGPKGQRPFLIALTALSHEGIELATRLAGFDFYMCKPISTNALLALLDDLSGRRRAARETTPVEGLPR